MPKKTTPEKPPTTRETSIAGKVLGSSSGPTGPKTLAGRVLSEAAAVSRQKSSGKK